MEAIGAVTGQKHAIEVMKKRIGKVEVDVWCRHDKSTRLPPIILIHGMFSGGWCFESWARFLCGKSFKVYVIKDLHFGENLTKVKFLDYVNKAESLIENLASKSKDIAKFKPIIIGHSMGGLIAQKLAEKYSCLVGGIVLVASAPPKGISAMSWDVAKAMAKHTVSLMFNLPIKIDKSSTFKLILNQLGGDDRKERIFKKFVFESPKVVKQLAFSKISINHKKVFCKILVVAGSHDKLLPMGIQLKIANRYESDYRFFLKGHMLMLEDEDKDEIINAIYEWI